MKILYCIPTLGYGGAERQLAYLGAGMTKGGHEVHVAFTKRGPNDDRLAASGVAMHDVGGRGNYDPRILLKLVRLMTTLRPDIVQTTLTQMDILGGIAALVTRTRWILRESSAAPSYPPGWKSTLRRLLGRRADAIVSNSREGEAYWHSGDVIPNGVPCGEIDAALPAAAEGRTILFAGRIDEGKNVTTLIDALSRIDLDVTATICGDGPERPALEQFAARLGIAQRVVFAGPVSDLWSRMKAADAVVTLSRFEGCSNVVMEAMACGTPLVVSDIPAHRELLDEQTALFVACDDAAQAAAAIRAVLLDGDAARARARAGGGRGGAW
jgi:glycosyltransferase involved in cell wall biosynthesis